MACISRTRQFYLLLAALLLAVCISGCGSQKSSKLKVRVGYFPNITHIQAVVGVSDGSFEKSLGENVQIEKKIFNAGPAEVEAFMSGKLDIGYIGPVPAINCFSKTGGRIKIIGGACNNGALLLTSVSSRIKSVSDLSGKKVAVPQFGNTQDIILRRFLKQHNLNTSDKGGTVNVIQSENANILTLLERGHIDAALVPEPWGSMIENRVKVNRLVDPNNLFDGNKYSTTVIIASAKFIKEHPEVLKKMDGCSYRNNTGHKKKQPPLY
ncbi:MAG TPA: ABC transporter substrate-binding protein [Ruminiclostridium sp.]|nr:ABC transporter substrate-binding protein [Ruminiclostridium sp.]